MQIITRKHFAPQTDPETGEVKLKIWKMSIETEDQSPLSNFPSPYGKSVEKDSNGT